MPFARPAFIVSLILVLLLAACGARPSSEASKPQIVATTQIVGDVVRAVGGDAISLVVLMPPDADPHAFEPAPRDAAILSEAQLIFSNGLDLEESLRSLLEAEEAKLIHVSDGVETIEFTGEELDGDHEAEEYHQHEGADPHTWMNPLNVKVWVDNIVAALSEMDPDHGAAYAAKAAAYKAELDDLDTWAEEQLARIPVDRRELVTDHDALGYFANRYSFSIIGAIVPSYSTLSEPSAGELAALERAVQSYGVPAIFVSTSVNPSLAERVAADTGVQLVALYTGSLSEADGEAPTYLDMVRYNVTAIVKALE